MLEKLIFFIYVISLNWFYFQSNILLLDGFGTKSSELAKSSGFDNLLVVLRNKN